MEGTIAICDCIKYNKVLKLIDLAQNQLNYDCAKLIAAALVDNTTLLSLIVCRIFKTNYNIELNFLLNFPTSFSPKLDDNLQVTSIGVYDILTAVNTDKSKVELLSFKVFFFSINS